MSRIILGTLKFILRLFIRKPAISGLDAVVRGEPAVFAANHLGTFAPILLMLYLPERCVPWVRYEITDYKACPEFILGDFIIPDLKVKPPLGRILSHIIGFFCVGLMRRLNAIPVYDDSRLVSVTMKRSIETLDESRPLLVFPENPAVPRNEILNEFYRGFISLGREYFRLRGTCVNFYPVCVNKSAHSVEIGGPLVFDPKSIFMRERERIGEQLMVRIAGMYMRRDESER